MSLNLSVYSINIQARIIILVDNNKAVKLRFKLWLKWEKNWLNIYKKMRPLNNILLTLNKINQTH